MGIFTADQDGSEMSLWKLSEIAGSRLQHLGCSPCRAVFYNLGREKITKYQANEKSSKSFCSNCGTSVFLVNGKHFDGNVVLALGTIDVYSKNLAPQIQVYTSNKAEWVNLHEDEPVLS